MKVTHTLTLCFTLLLTAVQTGANLLSTDQCDLLVRSYCSVQSVYIFRLNGAAKSLENKLFVIDYRLQHRDQPFSPQLDNTKTMI